MEMAILNFLRLRGGIILFALFILYVYTKYLHGKVFKIASDTFETVFFDKEVVQIISLGFFRGSLQYLESLRRQRNKGRSQQIFNNFWVSNLFSNRLISEIEGFQSVG